MTDEIQTWRLQLSLMRDGDLPSLWRWRNSADFKQFCTMRKSCISLEEFARELSSDFARDRFCQMIIRLRQNGRSREIGTIYCYNLNRQHGYAFVTIYIDSEFQKRGYGAEAFASFIAGIFATVPELHKIYAEAYSINEKSISCLRAAGFVQEGCFREHSVINNNRCDLLRFALFRRQFDTNAHLLRWLRSKSERICRANIKN